MQVFGGIDTTTHDFFVELVPCCGAATMLPLIQWYFLPGTTIWCSKWAAYNGLIALGYIHETVNCTEMYVDPVTGVHTNHTDSHWNACKTKFKAHFSVQHNFIQHNWTSTCGAGLASPVKKHSQRQSQQQCDSVHCDFNDDSNNNLSFSGPPHCYQTQQPFSGPLFLPEEKNMQPRVKAHLLCLSVSLPCELCQRGISCHRVSVCPSIRLSVTSRSCTKMAKPRIRLTTPYDSAGTLVFRCQKSWRNSNDITPNGGAKQRWGRFTLALFHQYLAISQKRCKIGTQLLWKANRNSCTLYRMALFSMTLGDP